MAASLGGATPKLRNNTPPPSPPILLHLRRPYGIELRLRNLATTRRPQKDPYVVTDDGVGGIFSDAQVLFKETADLCFDCGRRLEHFDASLESFCDRVKGCVVGTVQMTPVFGGGGAWHLFYSCYDVIVCV